MIIAGLQKLIEKITPEKSLIDKKKLRKDIIRNDVMRELLLHVNIEVLTFAKSFDELGDMMAEKFPNNAYNRNLNAQFKHAASKAFAKGYLDFNDGVFSVPTETTRMLYMLPIDVTLDGSHAIFQRGRPIDTYSWYSGRVHTCRSIHYFPCN